MLVIGQILKAQGISGEVKVRPITSDIKRFSGLKEVIIKNTSFVILNASIRGGFVYLTFQGITDRTAAEKLVGEYLHVQRENAISLPKNQFFIVDLIGCDVFAGDDLVGKLESIDQFGSADVYHLRCEKGTISFPFLKELVVNIDINSRKIQLNKKRFWEVAVEN